MNLETNHQQQVATGWPDDHNFCNTSNWNSIFCSGDAHESGLSRRIHKLTLEHLWGSIYLIHVQIAMTKSKYKKSENRYSKMSMGCVFKTQHTPVQ